MAKVSVQIVTWNSKKYINDCLQSLIQQTFTDFTVLVIDNASVDGTVQFVREHFPGVQVLENFKNVGFAKAHNQGIAFSKSEYVLVLNPDTMLRSDFLENIVSSADMHTEAGSIGGKGLKMINSSLDAEVQLAETTTLIDSVGLTLYKNRSVTNTGEGEQDTGQFETGRFVFGFSGSCVLFRRTALDAVVFEKEYYDNDFFAYKEDIDLAWRLQWAGWRAWYCPDAVYYHYRRMSGADSSSSLSTLRQRRAVDKSYRSTLRRIQRMSLRNHYCMLYKNDLPQHASKHAIKWFPRELGKLAYSVVFERHLFKGFRQFVQLVPRMRKKKKHIHETRKASADYMYQWFT